MKVKLSRTVISAVPPWFMIHSCTLLDAITSMATYVSLTSKNTQLMLFLLPSVVHLIDCVLFASTIQTLYKCTFYFYLHFIGFTCCVYYKSVLKIKSTRIGNVLFFIHLYKKKKTDWSYTSSRCTNLECCCQKNI